MYIKEVNMNNLHPKEEKKMAKLFPFNIQVKKTKVDVMFDCIFHVNLASKDLVSNIGLEVRNHPLLHLLGWINKDAKLKVTK
jgi:hypothetical protein